WLTVEQAVNPPEGGFVPAGAPMPKSARAQEIQEKERE
ncbi:hypothetical protein A2U01_0056848, partial [Trifolium medium]|nr:hypothetical protein [Trifolium medium]